MDDFFTGMTSKEWLSQQTYYVVALNKCTSLVKQEAAVKVTIPSNPHISLIIDKQIQPSPSRRGFQAITGWEYRWESSRPLRDIS